MNLPDSSSLPRHFQPGCHNGRAWIGAPRGQTVLSAHVVLLERGIELPAGRWCPDDFQAVSMAPQCGHPVVRRVKRSLGGRRAKGRHNRSLVELVVIEFRGTLVIKPQSRLQNEGGPDLLEPG